MDDGSETLSLKMRGANREQEFVIEDGRGVILAIAARYQVSALEGGRTKCDVVDNGLLAASIPSVEQAQAVALIVAPSLFWRAEELASSITCIIVLGVMAVRVEFLQSSHVQADKRSKQLVGMGVSYDRFG